MIIDIILPLLFVRDEVSFSADLKVILVNVIVFLVELIVPYRSILCFDVRDADLLIVVVAPSLLRLFFTLI